MKPETAPGVLPAVVQEPRMRLLVDKRQLLADTERLQGLLDEYCRFLATIGAAAEWTGRAQLLLRRHGQFLDEARLSLQTLELAAAVVRRVLALRPGEAVAVPSRDVRASSVRNAGGPVPPAAEAARHLIAQINALSKHAPLAIQERLRFLLHGLLRFLELLPRPDPQRMEQVLSEINVLTSNRESRQTVREVARLARDVYNSINALSQDLPLELLEESSEGASEAVRKLRGVIERLEQTATRNLDQLEQLEQVQAGDAPELDALRDSVKRIQQRVATLKHRHPAHAEALERVLERLGNEVAGAVMQLSQSQARQAESMLQLVSNQSFQDLTGTTLEKIIAFVESMQMRLIAVLERYRTVLGLLPADAAPAAPAPASAHKAEATQDQVDELLSKFGF